jgi:polysaccharide export outer membrane protein
MRANLIFATAWPLQCCIDQNSSWRCDAALYEGFTFSIMTMTFMCASVFTLLRVLLLAALVSACAAGAGRQGGNDATADALSRADLKVITPDLLHSQTLARANRADAEVVRLFTTVSDPYQLGSGDILSIVIWGHPDLTSGTVGGDDNRFVSSVPAEFSGPAGFVIDDRGMITYPYIGEIRLAGLTTEQARAALAQKLTRYIRKPNIVLRVRSFRSKRVYVDGELKTPGLLTIDDIRMSLVEAINRAGGMLPTADQSRITLTRQGVTYAVDLPDLMKKGLNPTQLVLADGDVLRVPSRDESQVFVSGEVVAPRAIAMHDGRLSLSEALGASGGINPVSGDPRQVYVIRKAAPNAQVYLLDARDPGAFALAEEFMLAPKDVVFVAASPLTNWHRTISSLLPGALSSAVGAVGTRQ